jgi:hypothetical protein
MEDGVEPWKMYFSDVGMFLKICGLRRKFSASTDLGVCAGISYQYHGLKGGMEGE